jgi:hypothetical protein
VAETEEGVQEEGATGEVVMVGAATAVEAMAAAATEVVTVAAAMVVARVEVEMAGVVSAGVRAVAAKVVEETAAAAAAAAAAEMKEAREAAGEARAMGVKKVRLGAEERSDVHSRCSRCQSRTALVSHTRL